MIYMPPYNPCTEIINMAKLNFGGRLLKVREQRGMTQDELAAAVGSTQKNISKYELGTIGLPREPMLMKLATVLNVSPGWLAYGHEDLDNLDDDAIRVAIAWSQLSEDNKEVFKKLLQMQSSHSVDEKNETEN